MRGVLLACWVGAAFTPSVAVAQSPKTPEGLYTEAQAKRGGSLYREVCAPCHGLGLDGTELAPPLAGDAFSKKWSGRPVSTLLDVMQRQMPLNSPGGLDRQQSADILSFMLERAGFRAGNAELAAEDTSLGQITLGRGVR